MKMYYSIVGTLVDLFVVAKDVCVIFRVFIFFLKLKFMLVRHLMLVYRCFVQLLMSADTRRAQKVRRNYKRLDTQRDRCAFLRERKMIYCHQRGSHRVHGEL